MCGRYYVDDNMEAEIEKLIRKAEGKLRRDGNGEAGGGRDIYPAGLAPVLAAGQDGTELLWQRWGFPGYKKGQIIFNARSETALEKSAFRESVRKRRAVIPAAWFYEWNQAKEKITFYRKECPVLYMAGCFREYEDGGHFVVLTTGANASMRSVHDRMPLLLEAEEIDGWLGDGGLTESFLHKIPPELESKAEYEQQVLFAGNSK